MCVCVCVHRRTTNDEMFDSSRAKPRNQLKARIRVEEFFYFSKLCEIDSHQGHRKWARFFDRGCTFHERRGIEQKNRVKLRALRARGDRTRDDAGSRIARGFLASVSLPGGTTLFDETPRVLPPVVPPRCIATNRSIEPRTFFVEKISPVRVVFVA